MNKKQGISVRTVVAIGIGTAIFFVLMRYIPIPTGVPDTNINLAYGFLALMGAIFGPIAGGLIAFLGHMFNDLTWGEPWWTWIVADGIYGILFGLTRKYLNIENGDLTKRKLVLFNVYQVLIAILVWGIIAPTGDVLVYSEPASKVYLQGITSVICNALSVEILGTILLVAYARTRSKKGSLKKES
ncbi:ECF-type riboflavin transporter substrate-binding protein [Pediococcus ethanolidurans]|uniref:ECF-type riboflavin transporter substrate-binding protein n=1 Tax=Pediococcus ethanolidurans TaxID=319653 RepID=UPI0021E8512A|nr:ECF-type riboflavin transporter substrate-binding protein [Pediococcus ethanolidurans]MCV3554753.1 ECF-type riboflavin transporter substrate-binding protein [Pediococcus ethanolidurans]